MNAVVDIPEGNEVAEFLQQLASVDAVRRLEEVMRLEPEVELDTALLIHGKMAARTIRIPAGTLLTGVLTNCDNVCIVCGDITVTTIDGPRRLTGFHVIPALAGFKRAGIAHADTWWTTVHHTHLTDVAQVEREMSGESHLLQTSRFDQKRIST